MSEPKTLRELARLPRGRGDVLIISLDQHSGDDGRPASKYLALRVFCMDGGTLRASRSGLSIYKNEIPELSKALRGALELLKDEERPPMPERPPVNFSGRFCPPNRQGGRHGRR